MPKAREFKHWVTSEVLPSLRKTGSYSVSQPQGAHLLALAVLEADKMIKEQQARIEEMKPKEIFADAVTASENAILMRDFAKMLRQNGISTGEKRLWNWMRNHGYVCQRSTQPTQKAMELGLFEIIERTIQRGDLPPRTALTAKLTGKGQVYFTNKFLKEK